MITSLIGTPGALLQLPYKGGLSTTTDRPVSFTRTLGGKQKAFLGPRGRRAWKVSFEPVGSLEVSGLVELVRSAGAVMWFPADATAGNMLSPQAVSFETLPTAATDAGLIQLPDGSLARSVAHTGTAVVWVGNAHGTYEAVPVQAGQTVSVGAWGLAGVRLYCRWFDATMATISTSVGAARTFAGWQWAQETFTAPTGAMWAALYMQGGSQYARPCISYGEVAQNRPGRGCPSAVVSGLEEALTQIDSDDAIGSINVTITEVG